MKKLNVKMKNRLLTSTLVMLVGSLFIITNSCNYFPLIPPGEGWPGNGNAYYVSPDGNDSNDGSKENPLATIQNAVELAEAGDIVIIRGGSYHQEVDINQSGTEMNPIVITGYPGERVIIEGDNTIPEGEYPAVKFKALLEIRGEFIKLHNLTVQNSRGRGVAVVRTGNVTLDHINSNHHWNAGVHILESESITVQNCDIWENAYSNAPPNRRKETWSPALNNVESNHSIIRNNNVFQNYGEGIDDLRSDNSIIENNTAYDNWSVNLYLDNSQYTFFNGNISYATDNTRFWRYSEDNPPRPSPGIVINDEPYSEQNPAIDQVIINNMVLNQGSGIAVWGIDAGENILIANNTIINTLEGETGNGCDGILVRGSAVIANSKIMNNVVYHANFGPVVTGKTEGVIYSHNNWSAQVGGAYASHEDVVCDPMLAMEGEIEAGAITGRFFHLTSSSPGIDGALKLDEVNTDYRGLQRSAKPDMGAYEYIGKRTKSACGSDDNDQDLNIVSFSPVADAFTNEGQPDNNYGNSDNLQCNAAVGYRKTSFLKFDVSGIEGAIENVVLKLYVLQGSASGTSSVYSITNDWVESEITWNMMPTGETIVGTFYNADAGSVIEIPITTDYISGEGTFSVEVRAESSSGRIDYASNENATVSIRPILEIGYQ